MPPSFVPNFDFDQKLGHLYEDALAILLENSPAFELLARNIQLHEAGMPTLGELDFVIRDRRSDALIHLELATKFYLAVETPTGLLLPGPDSRDNFFKKLHRLRTHQLVLSKKYRAAFPAAFRDEIIISRHLVHGCLFDHIDSPTPAKPDFANPDCRRGRWLKINEVSKHFPADSRFEIIPKPLWPVLPSQMKNIPLEPWNPTKSIDRCVMIRIEGELMPHFVTPADYPSTT